MPIHQRETCRSSWYREQRDDPNHAIGSYSGYDAYATAAGTPTGHVFDVHFNPAMGAATWTNITYDLGDSQFPSSGEAVGRAAADA